jgi:hypothetical protein
MVERRLRTMTTALGNVPGRIRSRKGPESRADR